MGDADQRGKYWEAQQQDSGPDDHKTKCTARNPANLSAKGPAEIEKEAHGECHDSSQHGRSKIRHTNSDGECEGREIYAVLENADDSKADELVKMCGSNG